MANVTLINGGDVRPVTTNDGGATASATGSCPHCGAAPLVGQMRAALGSALERYGAIAPDIEPGEEPAEDEDPGLRDELEEISAAIEAADAFLEGMP